MENAVLSWASPMTASIAWGIAKACHDHGAELAFTYQGEALEKRVRPLAEGVGSKIVLPCDVTDESGIEQTFKAIEKRMGQDRFRRSCDCIPRIRTNWTDCT